MWGEGVLLSKMRNAGLGSRISAASYVKSTQDPSIFWFGPCIFEWASLRWFLHPREFSESSLLSSCRNLDNETPIWDPIFISFLNSWFKVGLYTWMALGLLGLDSFSLGQSSATDEKSLLSMDNPFNNSHNFSMLLRDDRLCLADKFFVKFICYKFLKTLTTVTSKNFSKFLNYTLQNIKKKHISILKISTISYSKVLDKHPKNSLAKRGLNLALKLYDVILLVIQLLFTFI